MRHRLTDAERIADGQHHIADLQRVGIRKFQHRKLLVPVLYAQYRKIGSRILQNKRRLKLAFVGERDLDLVGALNDVIVRHDQTRRIDDHARTQRPLQLIASSSPRHAEEPAKNRVVQKRIAVLHHFGGVDVDHRRRRVVHDRGIGQAQFGLRG